MKDPVILRTENLSVHYGEKAALQPVSFTIREGEWWSVAGPNGAGKSTLAGALSRSVPYEGSVILQDRDIRSFSSAEYARKVGILSQHHAPAYSFTVEEVVSLGRYARRTGFFRPGDPDGARKVEEALEQTGLAPMRQRNMLTLSGGEQQRVFLAQVFAQDPDLLILDEPANHLDLPFQQELFDLIGTWLQSPGRAVITVMHDLNLARRYGTHALLLDGGKCGSQGLISEVMTPENLRQVYGMDVYAWMREMLSQWQ